MTDGPKVVTKYILLSSNGENEIINITDDVKDKLNESKLTDGIATIFVVGSTAALTTIEYEPGLKKDFPDMLERMAPKASRYKHDDTWHDGNGHSHVKASLIGPSLTIPFIESELTLGTWQQIVFLELDTHGRRRKIIVQLIGV